MQHLTCVSVINNKTFTVFSLNNLKNYFPFRYYKILLSYMFALTGCHNPFVKYFLKTIKHTSFSIKTHSTQGNWQISVFLSFVLQQRFICYIKPLPRSLNQYHSDLSNTKRNRSAIVRLFLFICLPYSTFLCFRDQQSAQRHVQWHSEWPCGKTPPGATWGFGTHRPPAGKTVCACQRVPWCKYLF